MTRANDRRHLRRMTRREARLVEAKAAAKRHRQKQYFLDDNDTAKRFWAAAGVRGTCHPACLSHPCDAITLPVAAHMCALARQHPCMRRRPGTQTRMPLPTRTGAALGEVGAAKVDRKVEEAAADCGSDPHCVCDWAGSPRQCLFDYCCGTIAHRYVESLETALKISHAGHVTRAREHTHTHTHTHTGP